MHNLTEVDNFDTNVTVPDPLVDARRAASVDGPFQQVTNRSRWLFNRVSDLLSQLAGTLLANNITASGDISATAGTVSAGGLSVGSLGALVNGQLLTTNLLAGAALAVGFAEISDAAGATQKVGPNFSADWQGTFFLIDSQSALVQFRLQIPIGDLPGTIVALKLSSFSASNVEIAQSDGSAIETITPNQTGVYLWDGGIWQAFMLVG